MSAPARPTHTTTPATTAGAAPAAGTVTRIPTSASTYAPGGSSAPSSRRSWKLSVGGIAVLAALFGTPRDVQAQSLFRDIVEFSCPMSSTETVPPADPLPGALVAESNYVYYVTRAGELRLVRLNPGTSTCNWWDLDGLTVTTGGLRFKPSANQAFIRGITDLQRINTVTNARTRWVDGLASVSDVALRVNGNFEVWTTGATTEDCDPVADPFTCLDIGTNVIQRFSVGNGSGTGTATRWVVGGGAGSTQYSGIDVHPYSSNLIYYSEPLANNIGELDTTTGRIRRWNLAPLGVTGPQQLDVDSTGKVWVVNTSGHLVRLDPTAPVLGNVHVADIPLAFLNGARALDADSLIGYTAEASNKVGMLSPSLTMADSITPVQSLPVTPSYVSVSATPVTIPQFTGAAVRVAKTALAIVTPDANLNGTFTEVAVDLATVNDPMSCPGFDPNFPDDPCTFPSTFPQGIAADPCKAGAFYAAIGGSTLRIAYVTLMVKGSPGGGAVTGSGKVPLTDPVTGLPAGTGYFTLWAHNSGTAKGSLTYTAPDGKIDALQITGLAFSGNTATVTGLCKSGSSCTTFQLKLTDGGWQTSQDIFKVTKDPILGLGLEKGGSLASGGIKLYRWQ